MSIVIRPLEDADHDTWEEQFCAWAGRPSFEM